MIHQYYLFFFFILSSLALPSDLESQYIPISRRYPGIQIRGSNQAVTVQLVYDPTCDGSAEFDQIIRQIQVDLNNLYPGKFTFKFAINALPYHISSFKLAQAIKYTNQKQGPQAALKVYRYFLDNINKYDENAIKDITISAHMDNIALAVSTMTGLDNQDLRKQIKHYSSTDGQTRKWTKYVMGTLRIPGTPFILVNGARLDGGTSMNASQLKDLLIKLL